MFRLLVAIACGLLMVNADPTKRRVIIGDYQLSDIKSFPTSDDYARFEAKGKYGPGSGLKSIAQGSAEQAEAAVTNQNSAASQAAFAAKSSLAQAAVGASAKAQVALVGKQILAEKLARDVHEAGRALQIEVDQFHQTQRYASAAREAAQLGRQQLDAINVALNAAKTTSAYAQQSAEQSAAKLGSQTAMVGAAKRKLASLSEQLYSAEVDLRATEVAAREAEASAESARSGASQVQEFTEHMYHH